LSSRGRDPASGAFLLQRGGRDLVMVRRVEKPGAGYRIATLSTITGESASTVADPGAHRRYADKTVSLRLFPQ
jgi:hypothetical protein